MSQWVDGHWTRLKFCGTIGDQMQCEHSCLFVISAIMNALYVQGNYLVHDYFFVQKVLTLLIWKKEWDLFEKCRDFVVFWHPVLPQ